MLLSAVSVLVVGQSSSEIPEGLMNNPVFCVTNVQWAAKIVFLIQKLSRKVKSPNETFVLFMFIQYRIYDVCSTLRH